jgi:hypothetical protein
MTKRLLLASLVLLAACSRAPSPAAGPEDPALAACRAEARNSPEVREVMRAMNTGNATQRDRIEAQRAVTEGRVFDECLRQRGLRRGGGVERVQPQGFF